LKALYWDFMLRTSPQGSAASGREMGDYPLELGLGV